GSERQRRPPPPDQARSAARASQGPLYRGAAVSPIASPLSPCACRLGFASAAAIARPTGGLARSGFCASDLAAVKQAPRPSHGTGSHPARGRAAGSPHPGRARHPALSSAPASSPDEERTLPSDFQGAIDCDVHPRLPTPKMLSQHMDEFWRDTVDVRGIDVWDSMAYPANAPFTVRPDWRRARADANAANLAAATLDRFDFAHAILHCLFPVQTFRDENLAAAFARATNDWIAKEWLDKDKRLRASLVLPIQSAERSVEEIERLAADRRFVAVLALAMGATPLGKSRHCPTYSAAWRPRIGHG